MRAAEERPAKRASAQRAAAERARALVAQGVPIESDVLIDSLIEARDVIRQLLDEFAGGWRTP